MCMDDLQIFSDGSGIDSKIGAAATAFNMPNKPTLRFHLGSDKEHMVFKGETVGVLLSVHLIKSMLRTLKCRIRSILIVLDNQLVILALEQNWKQPAQYLLDTIHEEIHQLKLTHRDLYIHIAWMPGHHNILGNEYVDQEVKKMANRHSSHQDDIPSLLHSKLPKSISAMKATHKATSQDEWIQLWKKSPRFVKLSKIDPDLPNWHTFKALSSLSRQGTSLLIQLCTGAVTLNCFLKKIKQNQTALCKVCWTPETINHFLLLCWQFHEQRQVLWIAIGRSANLIKAVLENPRHFKATARFVQATGHFKHYNTKNR